MGEGGSELSSSLSGSTNLDFLDDSSRPCLTARPEQSPWDDLNVVFRGSKWWVIYFWTPFVWTSSPVLMYILNVLVKLSFNTNPCSTLSIQYFYPCPSCILCHLYALWKAQHLFLFLSLYLRGLSICKLPLISIMISFFEMLKQISIAKALSFFSFWFFWIGLIQLS